MNQKETLDHIENWLNRHPSTGLIGLDVSHDDDGSISDVCLREVYAIDCLELCREWKQHIRPEIEGKK